MMGGFRRAVLLHVFCLAAEETKPRFVFPLGKTFAHVGRRHPRAPYALVRGTDYGDAHESSDIAANLVIRFFLFVC